MNLVTELPPPLQEPRNNLAGVRRRLSTPLAELRFSALAAQWRRHTIRIVAQRPPCLEEGTDLIARRIRGAWGQALMALADEGISPRPGAPDAFAVFFKAQGKWRIDQEIPKPYVFQVDLIGNRIEVRLTLFGFAGFWLKDAREGLLRALHKGIAVRSGSRVRARIEPELCEVVRHEAVALSPATQALKLYLLTPLSLRRRERAALDGASILLSLGNRISGLARWQDVSVNDDFGVLTKLAPSLRYDTNELDEPLVWDHYSTRAPGMSAPMCGVTGALTLEGDIAPFMPLLALGQTCHAGGRASLGLGRYEFVVLG